MAIVPRGAPAPKKSAAVAYACWFFMGGFGAHRRYLGAPGWLLPPALLSTWFLTFWFAGGWLRSDDPVLYALGLLTLTANIAGALVFVGDFFRIPAMTRRANRRGEREPTVSDG